MTEQLSRSREWVAAVTVVVAVLGLLIAGIAVIPSVVSASTAQPHLKGQVFRYFIDVTNHYDDIAAAPPSSPGAVLNIFQVSNTGQGATSIIGVEVMNGPIQSARFRALGGNGRPLTTWNDPIRIDGGESLMVGAYVLEWPEICDQNTLNSCPSMRIEFANGTMVPLDEFVTFDDCQERMYACTRMQNVLELVVQEFEHSNPFCRELVSEIDHHALALDPRWESAGEEGAKQICAGASGTF